MILLVDFLIFLSVAWFIHHLFQLQVGWEPRRFIAPPLFNLFGDRRFALYQGYLEKKMITARWKARPDQFLTGQILSGAGLMIGGTALMIFLRGGWLPFPLLIFDLSIFLLTGLFFPIFKLINDVRERQKNMVKDLSFYLDLMTLGVEAGLDYLNVLKKIMVSSKPGPLREELDTLMSQIQMGKSRSESWKEFSQRIDLPEIHSLILAFIQSDQTGSPLSGTLRTLSLELKARRFQLAEKRAYQMPVKMLVPLLGCIFPAVFILIFEPLVLKFLRLL